MYANLASENSLCLETGQEPEISESEQILFRGFRPDGDDEKQMRDLVFNNALLGEPITPICPSRQWFCDVVLSPYIKHEPENIHIAEHRPSGRLVGYLTGSTGGQQFERAQYNWVRKQVISLAVSLTMPWSIFDHASRQFATHVIFKGESERPSRPQIGVHWHYQVDKEFRDQGLGSKLLQRFTIDAMQADHELIWAEVMGYDQKPRQYFEERGWSVYDAKPTEIFGNHVDFPVETLCIAKPLSELVPELGD